MPDFIAKHPVELAIGGYWIFSAIVGGMPAPTEKSGLGYQWLFTSLHLLAGNVTKAISAKYPEATLPPGSTQIINTQAKTVIQTPPAEKE